VGWDVSLMLRVVGRVYGYKEEKKKKGLIESVLQPASNGESVQCWRDHVSGMSDWVLALCEFWLKGK
jgi:hypothetical protein